MQRGHIQSSLVSPTVAVVKKNVGLMICRIEDSRVYIKFGPYIQFM